MSKLMVEPEMVLGVSDFVAIFNQTLEFAYPSVMVSGELANFRVSKGKWVYFDLKDDFSSVKCFGTVYMLPGPLEDGMMLNIRAVPRLHNLYGFSLNILSIQPAGAGTIRRAADLLQAKLAAEGLFDESRKRTLPYPPTKIGLVASGESAAYADFIKILDARWRGIDIIHVEVQVQGEPAPAQIVEAIERLNGLAEPPDVVVLTRGGGSAEDLQAFSTEQVTRAVAVSRVPTLVAIGHEVDISLAELAADQRASTPSNAAEMLVPDRRHVIQLLQDAQTVLNREITEVIAQEKYRLGQFDLRALVMQRLKQEKLLISGQGQLLEVLSPQSVLRRGYAIVRKGNHVVRSADNLLQDDTISVTFADGQVTAQVRQDKTKEKQ